MFKSAVLAVGNSKDCFCKVSKDLRADGDSLKVDIQETKMFW